MIKWQLPKRIFTSLLLVFILSNCSIVTFGQGNFEKKVFKASDGFDLNYQILFPENYDESKSYPLVLFLHGAGERGSDNEKQLKHGVKLFTTAENRAKFPCIVIAPQCPQESYWSSVEVSRDKYPLVLNFDYTRPSNPPLNAAIELVKEMIASKKAIKKQVYITGLSMGGMGTYEAVYKHPKLFAAAMPICGGGDEDKFTKAMAKVPFWIFHGDADAVVGVENSREAVAILKSLKANVTYTEYPGVNHNSWDNAFAEPEFLNWMFSKRK
ncbi:Alpha/beta hydrolase family protein [Spirosomataceae bacterium TFI 002]|nr:Alpha/beta hydrolase family protein [Spirosomataceae bacterium TFI 002]